MAQSRYNQLLLPAGYEIADVKNFAGQPGVEVRRIGDNQTMTDPVWLHEFSYQRRRNAVIRLTDRFNWHLSQGHFKAASP